MFFLHFDMKSAIFPFFFNKIKVISRNWEYVVIGGINMSIQNNLLEIERSLSNLEKTGVYDVEKFGHSLIHLTSQLEYFYCHLVKEGKGNIDNTYYRVTTRPSVHQLAYFNIGRGFPKELMDGHWCYVLKDLGYKMLVVPCTSIKNTPCNPEFEMDIKIKMGNEYSFVFKRSRLSGEIPLESYP